jgi:glutamyl-tRNA reductase
MQEAVQQLFLVGANHRSAMLRAQGCAALDADARQLLHASLMEAGVGQAVTVTTCNRAELYFAPSEGCDPGAAAAIFARALGLAPAALREHGYAMQGADAVRHLMEVCAGLDSQMLGETEILGQVKQAYARAVEDGSCGPMLHRLFQKSFQASKLARQLSGICIGQTSLGAVAAELARRVHGDLARSAVLVVGAGQVGTDVARALTLRGAQDVSLCSRRIEKGRAVAHSIGAKALDYEDWKAMLPHCDVAVFCTSSPCAILGSKEVSALMDRRRARPLFILDLAMPLNVESAVAELPDVYLYTFADMAAMANENYEGRLGQVEKCREIIAQRAASLWEELVERESAARCPQAGE